MQNGVFLMFFIYIKGSAGCCPLTKPAVKSVSKNTP